jgi:hypothetical protein
VAVEPLAGERPENPGILIERLPELLRVPRRLALERLGTAASASWSSTGKRSAPPSTT